MTRGPAGKVVGRCRNIALALAIAGGANACGAAEEPASEAAGTASAPIVNGTVMNSAAILVYGVAAVYHKAYEGETSFWWPRPCSGVIVRSVSGISHVLTAKHCVTKNASADGELMRADEIRVTRAGSPGIANPNPPASAITAASISAMPITEFVGETRDMALVRVNVDWSTSVNDRPAIFVNSAAALPGAEVVPLGYGLSVNDPNCYENPASTTGAGTARIGGRIAVTNGVIAGDGGQYMYPNTFRIRITCGDSGGPDETSLGHVVFGGWRHIIGVHSTGGTTAHSTATNKWLQDQLGPYLSPYSSPGLNVGLNGSSITLDSLADPDNQVITVTYNPATKQIATFNNQCLDHTLTWGSCSSSNSRSWNLSLAQKVSNVQTGLCLTHSGSFGIVTQACSNANQTIARRQMWAWHFQP